MTWIEVAARAVARPADDLGELSAWLYARRRGVIAFKEWGILGSHSQSYTSPPEVGDRAAGQVEAHPPGERRRKADHRQGTKRVSGRATASAFREC